MTFSRLGCLRLVAASVLCALPLLSQQNQPQAQPPKPQPPKNNPFEAVPEATEPPPQAPKPQIETVKPPSGAVAQPAEPGQDVVDSIVFQGVRRVPQDTLRAMIFTKSGDKYDEETLHRDFMALWNTGRFDDIRVEREAGPKGWIIRFVMAERRVIRSIKYDGNKSVTTSEILDRFKERKVGLSVESQYDPNKIQRAKNVLQEYLAERGRQFATVEPELRQVPPSSLEIVFKVDEGPKVKVGDIVFHGNEVFNALTIRRAMKNLRPIGIPNSIFFESIWAKTFDSTKLGEDQERIEEFYRDKGYFLAKVTGATVKTADFASGRFRLPLIWSNKPGKGSDIDISIEEGRQYHLNKVNYVGVKQFK